MTANGPVPCSIPAAFGDAVASFADAPLVVTPEATHSFGRIDQLSDGVAAGLAAAGVVKGARIGLCCPNQVEFLVAYIGILKAGAVVVPVNLLIQADEVAFLLDDAGVCTVIYHAALADRIAAVRPRLPDGILWVCIGADAVTGSDIAFDTLQADTRPAPQPVIDAAKDLAAILYTSGTTGRPKGAMLSHQNLVSNTGSVMAALQLRPGKDRLLVVLPMFHSFAATVGMLTPALYGLSLVPVARFDPNLVTRVIAATACTVFLGVPSMYNLVVRLDDEQLARWRTIRFGIAGGAAMPVELLRRFEQRFGFPILEGDGPTECSPVTCVNPVAGPRKPGSVGLPVPDVEMAVLDEVGDPLPVEAIGEVCVRGPNVMQGYWRQPDATAECFARDWFRTGDLGYIDSDGFIFLVDRKKDMIIVNGMNVYPRMVEEVLYGHPDILEAAVVGEPDALHGEVVVAHVVWNSGVAPEEHELRAFCRAHLGRHQLPRRFVVHDALPKNATGKILKRALRRAGEIERGIDDQGQS